MYYALVHYLQNYPKELDLFRQQFDPRFQITGPHLTLIFPVNATVGQEKLIAHISAKLAQQNPFQITLTGIEKSWDNYIFLTVGQGNERLTELHDRLYQDMLSHFLRSDIHYIPHVTLGKVNPENEAVALKAANELDLHFDITIDRLQLIRCQDDMAPHDWEKEFRL